MANLYCAALGSVCNLSRQREYSEISPSKLQGVISVSVQPSLTANRASSEPPTPPFNLSPLTPGAFSSRLPELTFVSVSCFLHLRGTGDDGAAVLVSPHPATTEQYLSNGQLVMVCLTSLTCLLKKVSFSAVTRPPTCYTCWKNTGFQV